MIEWKEVDRTHFWCPDREGHGEYVYIYLDKGGGSLFRLRTQRRPHQEQTIIRIKRGSLKLARMLSTQSLRSVVDDIVALALLLKLKPISSAKKIPAAKSEGIETSELLTSSDPRSPLPPSGTWSQICTTGVTSGHVLAVDYRYVFPEGENDGQDRSAEAPPRVEAEGQEGASSPTESLLGG